MGTLRSTTDHTGLTVNGVALGQPVRESYDEDTGEGSGEFRWDDSRLPSGVIEDDGTITLDETDDL